MDFEVQKQNENRCSSSTGHSKNSECLIQSDVDMLSGDSNKKKQQTQDFSTNMINDSLKDVMINSDSVTHFSLVKLADGLKILFFDSRKNKRIIGLHLKNVYLRCLKFLSQKRVLNLNPIVRLLKCIENMHMKRDLMLDKAQ
uniref:Uncharacterized protein n=1 Tax=Lactuca sativa TaxID=4236 RepID=A0A9R1X921_LACSA|nr:hypothetical protein LSAT_V11C500289950 [Lactuca sativa]